MLADLGISSDQIAVLQRKTIVPVKGKRTKITLGIDSGAEVTVFPEEICNDYPLVASESSRRGVPHYAVNGTPVYDKGMRNLRGWILSTDGLVQKGVAGHVCKVTKGLLCVADMNDAGIKVVLDGNDSYMEEKATGTIFPIRACGRVFEFDIEVDPFSEIQEYVEDENVNAMSSAGFQRQARLL
jgi:hypothetical protein